VLGAELFSQKVPRDVRCLACLEQRGGEELKDLMFDDVDLYGGVFEVGGVPVAGRDPIVHLDEGKHDTAFLDVARCREDFYEAHAVGRPGLRSAARADVGLVAAVLRRERVQNRARGSNA
jgi:hypothetical protein